MIDLVGNIYGELEVIEFSHKKGNKSFWKCKCSCGENCIKRGDLLKLKNRHPSCGCKTSELLSKANTKTFNMVGEIYDYLTVIKNTGKRSSGGYIWECKCKCGNTHYVSRNGLITGSIKSCGCLQKEKASIQGKNNKGENNGMYGKKPSNYKGENYRTEYERDRKSAKYKKWRLDVFDRDLFICKKCGKSGETLNAHHIKSFHKYKELRFDINNGITLCEKCHNNFHKIYGNKNFTKENFDEWSKDS